MTPEYRKKQQRDAVWHSCMNCARWPTENYIAARELAPNAVICRKCKAKTQLGECKWRDPDAA